MVFHVSASIVTNLILTSQSTGRLTVVHVFAKTKSAKTAPTYAPVFEALTSFSNLYFLIKSFQKRECFVTLSEFCFH